MDLTTFEVHDDFGQLNVSWKRITVAWDF